MQFAYLFETRGIQRFLFASGKLRDMLGGSELLDYLCAEGGLLDQTLKALALAPQSPRRAGGAFYLLFSNAEDAQRMRNCWRLACAGWLPGVEQVDALCSAPTARQAIAAGLSQLHEARNRLNADLPRPSPLTERSPRTGLAAVQHFKGESLDAATARQRNFKRPEGSLKLEQRFLDEPGYLWPVNFEEQSRAEQRFPLGERRMVGLIHADGNGLGELLRVINEACAEANDQTYLHLYRTFSDGLTEATQKAAQQASREVLMPQAVGQVLPARPLVLGGDDLTILVRADLALPFTQAFLAAFEQHSASSMRALHAAFEQAGLQTAARKLPDSLTACAGVCFMKCSQPFQAGHELAESLCRRAKSESRKVRKEGEAMPATLALHKVQDSLLADAESQFQQNYSIQLAGEPVWQLALPAYALQPGTGLPFLEDLYRLSAVFDQHCASRLNDRPLRELATLWHVDPALARQRYRRWRELSGKHQPQALQAFDECLLNLIGSLAVDLPCNTRQPAQSPLADLLNLLSLQTTACQPEELAQ